VPHDLGQQVSVPVPAIGEDSRAYSARVLVALKNANSRLDRARKWVDGAARDDLPE
jgi:hypothetical protein